MKLATLSFAAVWQVTYRSYIDYSKFSPHNQPIELRFQGQLHMGAYWSKMIVDLNRRFSPKWGVGRYSVVGPLSRGYGMYNYVIWPAQVHLAIDLDYNRLGTPSLYCMHVYSAMCMHCLHKINYQLSHQRTVYFIYYFHAV